MRHLPRLRVGAILAMVIFTTACSTKVAHVEYDPSFTEASLRAGGIAVAGVTSNLEEDEDVTAFNNRYAPVLRQKLLTEQDVAVVEWGQVRQALGDEAASGLLQSYRDYGSLEPPMSDSLAAAVSGTARYAAFARVEDDAIEFEENSYEKEIIRKTIRKSSVTFRVYDLETQKRVWETIIEGHDENKKTILPDDPDSSIWESIIESILTSPDGKPYPEAPERSAVLRMIFGKFAKELAVPPG